MRPGLSKISLRTRPLFILDADLGRRRPRLLWRVSRINKRIHRWLFLMRWWRSIFQPWRLHSEPNFSMSSLWKSFLSILTTADWWFSKEKYVLHNDIMNSQRKKFWAVTKPCLGFLVERNLTYHLKFRKPSLAQITLMRFFERNFVFRRYRLRSGIRFFHKPREMDSFDL